jgi:uncharacterized coiled-coil protein SlyX
MSETAGLSRPVPKHVFLDWHSTGLIFFPILFAQPCSLSIYQPLPHLTSFAHTHTGIVYISKMDVVCHSQNEMCALEIRCSELEKRCAELVRELDEAKTIIRARDNELQGLMNRFKTLQKICAHNLNQ